MKQQILVITDDPKWQRFIRTSLDPLGYQVVMIPKIAEGLAYVHTTKPELIILDTMTPGGNGEESSQYFQQVSDALLIVLMRKSCPDDPIEALKKGAHAYLVRPGSEREFQAQVNVLLRRTPDPEETDQAY